MTHPPCQRCGAPVVRKTPNGPIEFDGYSRDDVFWMLNEMGSSTVKLVRAKGHAMTSRRAEIAQEIMAEYDEVKKQ